MTSALDWSTCVSDRSRSWIEEKAHAETARIRELRKTNPIAAHLRHVLDRRGPPQPLRCLCPGCGETIALWPPEPGGTTRFKCPACGATGAMGTRPHTALTPG